MDGCTVSPCNDVIRQRLRVRGGLYGRQGAGTQRTLREEHRWPTHNTITIVGNVTREAELGSRPRPLAVTIGLAVEPPLTPIAPSGRAGIEETSYQRGC